MKNIIFSLFLIFSLDGVAQYQLYGLKLEQILSLHTERKELMNREGVFYIHEKTTKQDVFYYFDDKGVCDKILMVPKPDYLAPAIFYFNTSDEVSKIDEGEWVYVMQNGMVLLISYYQEGDYKCFIIVKI